MADRGPRRASVGQVAHQAIRQLRLGTTAGHAVTFADVTERALNESIEHSEHAARAVIASANEAVLVCDREGIIC